MHSLNLIIISASLPIDAKTPPNTKQKKINPNTFSPLRDPGKAR